MPLKQEQQNQKGMHEVTLPFKSTIVCGEDVQLTPQFAEYTIELSMITAIGTKPGERPQQQQQHEMGVLENASAVQENNNNNKKNSGGSKKSDNKKADQEEEDASKVHCVVSVVHSNADEKDTNCNNNSKKKNNNNKNKKDSSDSKKSSSEFIVGHIEIRPGCISTTKVTVDLPVRKTNSNFSVSPSTSPENHGSKFTLKLRKLSASGPKFNFAVALHGLQRTVLTQTQVDVLKKSNASKNNQQSEDSSS